MDISPVFSNLYSTKTQKTTKQCASKVEGTDQAWGVSDAEKLESFKKEIRNEVNSLSWGSSISIQITDEAFEKMMSDSKFKNKMMNLIREDAKGSHKMCGGTLIRIDENGYSGYSYMADHAKEANTAYDSHSKDGFYSKKDKKQDTKDIWEQKWLERKRKREILDEDYEKKLYTNKIYKHKDEIARLYEKGTISEIQEDV